MLRTRDGGPAFDELIERVEDVSARVMEHDYETLAEFGVDLVEAGKAANTMLVEGNEPYAVAVGFLLAGIELGRRGGRETTTED